MPIRLSERVSIDSSPKSPLLHARIDDLHSRVSSMSSNLCYTTQTPVAERRNGHEKGGASSAFCGFRARPVEAGSPNHARKTAFRMTLLGVAGPFFDSVRKRGFYTAPRLGHRSQTIDTLFLFIFIYNNSVRVCCSVMTY